MGRYIFSLRMQDFKPQETVGLIIAASAVEKGADVVSLRLRFEGFRSVLNGHETQMSQDVDLGFLLSDAVKGRVVFYPTLSVDSDTNYRVVAEFFQDNKLLGSRNYFFQRAGKGYKGMNEIIELIV